jgi:hypothetical protein
LVIFLVSENPKVIVQVPEKSAHIMDELKHMDLAS